MVVGVMVEAAILRRQCQIEINETAIETADMKEMQCVCVCARARV